MRLVLTMFVFAASLVFFSCELEAPAPIVGPAPRGLIAEPITLPGLVWEARVTGSVKVWLPVELRTPDVQYYVVAFDTLFSVPYVRPSDSTTLQLASVPDGVYEIMFFVYLSKPYPGTLGLLGAPNRSYYTLVTVDHAAPPPPPAVIPPTIIDRSWTDHPRITWSMSLDTGFVEYIIRRHYPSFQSPVEVGTLSGRGSTSFIDTTQQIVLGLRVPYSVGTAALAGTSYSDTVSVEWESRFPVNHVAEIVADPASTEAFVVSNGGQRFSVVSTSTHTLLRSVSPAPQTGLQARWTLSEDRSTAVCLSVDMLPGGPLPDTVWYVSRFPLSSLSLASRWQPVFEVHPWMPIAAGHGNRLYVADKSRRLLVMDAVTGTVLDSSISLGTEEPTQFVVSNDRDRLFVLSFADFGNGPAKIEQYDVTNVAPVFGAGRSFAVRVATMRTNPSDSRLVIQYNESGTEGLEMLDPASLGTVGSITLPADHTPGSLDYSFAVTDTDVYITYRRSDGYAVVSQMSLATGQMVRHWPSVDAPHLLHATSNGTALYVGAVFTLDSPAWVISLGVP